MVPLNKRVTQRTFIRIKAVFSLDITAWLHLLWNFPLLIFWVQCSCKAWEENIHSLHDRYTRIWTSDCLNVKQDTFHCFRKTVRLTLLKRETQELPSWKAWLGSWKLRGLGPFALCPLAYLLSFWIKETLTIDAVCTRCLSIRRGDQNLSF